MTEFLKGKKTYVLCGYVLLLCVLLFACGCSNRQQTVAMSLSQGIAQGATQAAISDPNSVIAQKLAAALADNPKLAPLIDAAKTVDWNDPNSVKAYGVLVGVTLATEVK